MIRVICHAVTFLKDELSEIVSNPPFYPDKKLFGGWQHSGRPSILFFGFVK